MKSTDVVAPTFEFLPFVSTSSRTLAIYVQIGKRAKSGAMGTKGLIPNPSLNPENRWSYCRSLDSDAVEKSEVQSDEGTAQRGPTGRSLGEAGSRF